MPRIASRRRGACAPFALERRSSEKRFEERNVGNTRIAFLDRRKERRESALSAIAAPSGQVEFNPRRRKDTSLSFENLQPFVFGPTTQQPLGIYIYIYIGGFVEEEEEGTREKKMPAFDPFPILFSLSLPDLLTSLPLADCISTGV